jgi:hypothetical protein
MKAEKIHSQKSKDKMEDLMEAKESELNSMRATLETEMQRRVTAEVKLTQLLRPPAALQQIILEDEMPQKPKKEFLQPLLTNHSH